MKDGDRVAIATIHPGELSTMYHESLLALMAHENQRAQPSRIAGVMNQFCATLSIPEERNRVTQRFFEDPDAPDWLLWIDADIGFAPTLVEELLAVADPQACPIVGALCFGWSRLGTGTMNESYGWLFPTLYNWEPKIESFIRRREFPENELIRVDATGAACVMIHRSALSVIQTQSAIAAAEFTAQNELSGSDASFVRSGNPQGFDWWALLPCHSPLIPNPYFGEDLSFCMRAKQAGLPVHVHTGIQVAHDDKRRPLTAAVYRQQQLDLPNIAVVATSAQDPGKLLELLQALRAQGETTRVLLADTGASREVLRGAQELFDQSWLSLFDQRDVDTVGAWNASLKIAWSEFGPWCNLLVLNDQLRIGPRFVSALAQGLRRDLDVGAVGATDEAPDFGFGCKPLEPGHSGELSAQQLLQSAVMIRGDLAAWFRFSPQNTGQQLMQVLADRQQQVAISHDTYLTRYARP